MKSFFSQKLALGTLILLATSQVMAQATEPAAVNAEGLKIRGFVDAQFKTQKSQDVTTGVSINDGALYFSHKAGDTEVFVDLPFMWSGGADANFVVGRGKAQAVISYTMDATKAQIGQFDTIYGLELNDAPDLVMTNQGILFNRLLPLTHTGGLITQGFGPATIRILAANTTAGKGDSGAQLRGKGEYGATVGYADEMFRAQLGYLTGQIVGAPDQKRDFTDLVVGGTFGQFVIDVEYAMEKVGNNDQGTGLAVLPAFKITPELTAAFRYERLEKVASMENETQYTLGAQYQLNESLRLKTDYSIREMTVAGTKTDDNMFAAAAVYKF